MSVINHVLKDLEMRDSRFIPIEIASVDTVSHEVHSSILTRPVVLLISLMLAISVGIWMYSPVIPSALSVVEQQVESPAFAEPTRPNNQPKTKVPQIQVQQAVNQPAIEVPAKSLPVTSEISSDKAKVVLTPSDANQQKPAEKPMPKFVDVAKIEITTVTPARKAADQLTEALELIKRQRWPAAESILSRLMDGPEDLAARKRLIGLYAENQKVLKYARLARQSINRYPNLALFKTEYARALFQQHDYQTVIDYLLSQSNRNDKQQALLGASYQRLNEHDKAVEFYSLSLTLNRQHAQNWIALGVSLEHTRQLEKALRCYQSAAELGGLSPRLQRFVTQRLDLLQRTLH